MLKTKEIIVCGLMLLAVLVLTVACSDDYDESNAPRQSASVELVPFAQNYREIENMTRATSPDWAPDDYYLYGDLAGVNGVLMSNERAPISVYFTQDGSPAVEVHRKFSYTSKWIIDEELENAGNYYLYGIVPYTAASLSIAPYGTYENGAVLTLDNLNSVMNQDVCFIVGAKHGNKVGDADPVPATENSKVAVGDFMCHIQKSTSNYIFLLFDHLYAALRFRFRVDDQYATLRAIKLKKLELLAYQDEACSIRMTKKVSASVTLRANSTGDSPVVLVTDFTPQGTTPMDPVPIYNNVLNPVLLPSGRYPLDYEVAALRGTYKYTDNMGFVPKTSSYYLLRSTYDVYDLDADGNPRNIVRQNCVAENKIDPRNRFKQESLDRGYMYTLRFTVKPTYLYVLSEPDLDNPTMTLN